MALGSVERVLVLGIVVVIVAILGIAVWGATGDDPGVPVLAADGGVTPGTSGVVPPRIPQAKSQFQGQAPGSIPLPGGQPGAQPGTQPAAGAGAAQGVAPGALSDALADGGAATKPPAANGATGPTGAMPAPINEIDRWKQLREAEKAQRAIDAGGAAPAPLAGGPIAPGSVTSGTVTPGALPQPLGVPLKNNVPESAPGTLPLLNKPVPVEPKASTYTVANGDSLWKIAVKQYGDSNIQEHVDAIIAANPSLDADRLKVGTTLNLPAKQTSVNRLPAKEQAKLLDSGLYEVKKGDTLSSIAKKQLGDANRWREIYDLNREHIADPSMLFMGTALRLPK
ncbi:MAG TPA: LysM peptidoglycan-binding domain-containing protein [Candidatus Limnocylindrales bacterium]|nr:LysM peptidoglycan-binding domain-containing protein [Candidatus Limnocylindrales bacterium]